MTRKFPVAIWQDAQGSFTGHVLDGARAEALDHSAANVLQQLKKYLTWCQRREELSDADFEDLEQRDFQVRIRPEYEMHGSLYPIGVPFHLRVTCILGRRKDDTLHCVIPTLDVRFSYQDGDPLEEIITEKVQLALGKLTPQQLSRHLMPRNIRVDAVHIRSAEPSRPNAESSFPTLEQVAEPLGNRARHTRFPRALHRDAEVVVIRELLVRGRSSLLLLGESGVGKTTVLVEAIRQVLRLKTEPNEQQIRRRFWRTSGQRLISGMQYLGQWEERCEKVIEELAETNSVLCVEELLELVRVGGCEPGTSVAAFLIPYLERGEVRLVGEVTPTALDACRRLLPGFADRFQIIRIPEFLPAGARQVLSTLFNESQRNLKLEIEDGVADLVYRLYKRFQPYAAFPGRAASFVRQLLDAAAQTQAKRIAVNDVLDRFQKETGLPDFLLRDDIPLPYDQVLRDFSSAVLGQPQACETATAVVTALKTGLNDPRRPLGVFLFCGPTGVGKTEMAKAMARYLFGAAGVQDRLVRLDMSEYASFGAAQRLLMSPDGEVSEFIKRVRRQPFVVVLLDEIEKAAPEIHDVLLGVLDEGRLTDRFGRTANLQSSIIIMTSNLGAERSAAIGFDGTVQIAFERIAMGTFRPEFFNRIDAVVTFQPLAHETIVALARRELEAIARRDGLTKFGLRLQWSDAVIEHLAAVGFDARYGARPLQRIIERQVVGPLSHWLLEHPGISNCVLHLELVRSPTLAVECSFDPQRLPLGTSG